MKTKEEIEKLAKKKYRKCGFGGGLYTEGLQYGRIVGFVDGYTQAIQDSDKRFTEEDIIKAIDIYRKEGLNVDKTLSENVEKLKTKVLELLTEYKQK